MQGGGRAVVYLVDNLLFGRRMRERAPESWCVCMMPRRQTPEVCASTAIMRCREEALIDDDHFVEYGGEEDVRRLCRCQTPILLKKKPKWNKGSERERGGRATFCHFLSTSPDLERESIYVVETLLSLPLSLSLCPHPWSSFSLSLSLSPSPLLFTAEGF